MLLTAALADPKRKPLSISQLRILASRVQASRRESTDRELVQTDLTAMGYGEEMAQRIAGLLSDEALLDYYLRRAERALCFPVTRAGSLYPQVLLDRLGAESPGCLWAKGDLSILQRPKISLVGSRDIAPDNRAFAREVGAQAARQGYTLVSGNARGADKIAQTACLEHGGTVICVVADSLEEKELRNNCLYLSENDFEQPFSPQRAISRNRVIHALGEKTFVAQSDYQSGGTWDGTAKNLRYGWSPVLCMADGTRASKELQQMGAVGITVKELSDFSELQCRMTSIFDL